MALAPPDWQMNIAIIIQRMRLILLLSSATLIPASLQGCTTDSGDNSQGSILRSPRWSNTTFSGYARLGVLFK
jgi:hypothetical protein